MIELCVVDSPFVGMIEAQTISIVMLTQEASHSLQSQTKKACCYRYDRTLHWDSSFVGMTEAQTISIVMLTEEAIHSL
jgi:hypothetical protein